MGDSEKRIFAYSIKNQSMRGLLLLAALTIWENPERNFPGYFLRHPYK